MAWYDKALCGRNQYYESRDPGQAGAVPVMLAGDDTTDEGVANKAKVMVPASRARSSNRLRQSPRPDRNATRSIDADIWMGRFR